MRVKADLADSCGKISPFEDTTGGAVDPRSAVQQNGRRRRNDGTVSEVLSFETRIMLRSLLRGFTSDSSFLRSRRNYYLDCEPHCCVVQSKMGDLTRNRFSVGLGTRPPIPA
jgi:hypothetical protein